MRLLTFGGGIGRAEGVTELAAKALEYAMADLGVTEHPRGSNRGPEVDAYLKSVGLDPSKGSFPWCAAFVSYHIQRAANTLAWPLAFKRSASTLRLIDLNWQLSLAEPEAGCVFVHKDADRIHGHAGFVTEVRADGSIATLEGNSDATGSRTGGSVVRQIRAPGYAACYLAIR